LKKKILITGARGFIGINLENYFKGKKINYKKIKTELILKKKTSYFKDVTHFVHLGFDFKINKKFKKLDRNKTLIKRIVYLSGLYNFKIIFPSTCTYKYNKKNRKIISNKIYPFNNYSLSKINCENYLYKSFKAKGGNITILRIFNVYGPHQKKGWLIPDLLSKFLCKDINQVELNFYNNTRDFIYIKDVCSAIFKSLKLCGFNILNVGTGHESKILKIAKLIAARLKSKKKILLLEKISKKNSISKANINKTVQILKWSAKIDLLTGIKKTINHAKKEPKSFNFL